MIPPAQRLKELIEFAQQTALLRASPVADISRHGVFLEYEHSIVSLPGLSFDVTQGDGDVETWLVVERLQESPVPKPGSVLLNTWIELANNPAKEPTLRSHVEFQKLLDIGALLFPKDKENFDPNQLVALDSFEHKKSLEDQFKTYVASVWKPWAMEEKRRRQTISLYAKLFTLKQQLEDGIVDTQIELVWGTGVAIWKMDGVQVSHPLITRLVEISLNETTMAIEVRPRDIDARVEVDIYSAADNLGVPDLEKAAKEFFTKAATTFSPFDRGTFEPLLRSAVTHLDPKGVYWPTQSAVEDRTLPKSSEELRVTDTWVLFARPRSASIFIQDLERFKKKLEDKDEADKLPKAVKAVVSDPTATNEDTHLPPFRGVSIVYGSGGASDFSGQTPQNLFFPMPFNDEQVRIVQLLECFDGVVVQGPPGTGKTHTIANVICHYLALGKRILVTSMKDPALAVLKEKLPEEISPLAISLLTSEQDGMKQFEYAISKIASEVQRLDRIALSREISHLEYTIDVYHAKLAKIDSQISEWALKNLSHIDLDGESLDPYEAAEIVVINEQELSWFDDPISIGPDFYPNFTDADIVRLREARRALANDIDYLDCKLPLLAAFPEVRELLRAHQDLARSAELQSQVDSGEVPQLIDASKEIFETVQGLSAQISNLKLLRQAIQNSGANWTNALSDRIRTQVGNQQTDFIMVECSSCETKNRLKKQTTKVAYRCGKCSSEIPNPFSCNQEDELSKMLESLGAEFEAAVSSRNQFLLKPVTAPDDIDLRAELVDGIRNLATGKCAFEFLNLIDNPSLDTLARLGEELKLACKEQQLLSVKPVSAPDNIEDNDALMTGVENLANGKRPFGFVGALGKSTEKNLLSQIQIAGTTPKTGSDWQHVFNNMYHRKHRKSLLKRWNKMVDEFSITRFSVKDIIHTAIFTADSNCHKILAHIDGEKQNEITLKSIRIGGKEPKGTEDWQHALEFIQQLNCLRVLMTRWNALAGELQLPVFIETPAQAADAHKAYMLYRQVVAMVSLETEVIETVKIVLPIWVKADCIRTEADALEEVEKILLHHLTRNRLAETWALKERFQRVLSGCNGRITSAISRFLDSVLGNPMMSDAEMQGQWVTLMEELRRVHGLMPYLDTINTVSHLIESSGAPKWAYRLRKETVNSTVDNILPDNWKEVWRLKRLSNYLNAIDGRAELKRLSKLRSETEVDLARTYQEVVTKRTWLRLAENATHDVRSALQAYLVAIKGIGKGTKGAKRAVRYRQNARMAAEKANPAIPCWIMPHYRVSESLPAAFGCFDLVVIDEASQSDLSALPAILRAHKVLVVGDDKQISPEGVGLEEEKVRSLMVRFLVNQVETYRPQMTPERSIYDLFKVVFAKSAVMLKEHFRCVAPIIEYSKREFYNHELKPLRLSKKSERLSPPLIDVIVEDGFRKGDINPSEARFIVDEIQAIAQDAQMANRSIGVVSLLGDKQAIKVWEMLEDEIGIDIMRRHKIACGDARTFQGKERDIMFLSMVVSRGNATALSRDTFAQRFNVAASRARDRMYLVRSVVMEDLSDADRLRRSLIAHFAAPFAQDETRVKTLRELCESPFEREVYDILTERGYRVIPQVPVGEFRIDLVVEGHQDNRLAIECDGDRYHGADRFEDDIRRQRILERAGWRFWRCFASTFIMHKHEIVEDLLQTLQNRGIEPIGSLGANNNIHVEQRRFSAFTKDKINESVVDNIISDDNKDKACTAPINIDNDDKMIDRLSPIEPIQHELFNASQLKDGLDKSTNFKIGERVRHPLWGVGIVSGLEGYGENIKAEIRFATVGTKKLAIRVAKLEKAE